MVYCSPCLLTPLLKNSPSSSSDCHPANSWRWVGLEWSPESEGSCVFLSAVFSSKLFEKTARLPSKNLADKRAPFTGSGGRTRLRSRTSSSTSGLHSQESSAFQTCVTLWALSCLSCSSTANSESCTTAGRQGDNFVVGQEKKRSLKTLRLKLDKMVKLSWNVLLHINFPLNFVWGMSVYLNKKKPKGGTEKWVEVCGKPGDRPWFVWLGFCSRVCFFPDTLPSKATFCHLAQVTFQIGNDKRGMREQPSCISWSAFHRASVRRDSLSCGGNSTSSLPSCGTDKALPVQ